MTQIGNNQINALATTTKAGTVDSAEFIRVRDAAVSVKEYGALGDGTTNDTIAIQNALIANLVVNFPAATFLIGTDATLSINDYSSILGIGQNSTILKLNATTDYGMYIASHLGGGIISGQRISDLTITAPSATHYAVGLKSSTDGAAGFLSGGVIEHVIFNNCASGCIQPLTNNLLVDFVFRDCKFQNCVTTNYLIDLLDPNLTTVFLDHCYFSNNKNTAAGCCIRISGDSLNLSNFVVESSGRAVDMVDSANLSWIGGRCEDMFGPIINSSSLGVGYGTVSIEGVMFERGPVGGATPVIIINAAGLNYIKIKNCQFEGWRSCDFVIANISTPDINIEIENCSFIDCDGDFIAQFGKFQPDVITSWSNLALHSSFEDTDHGSIASGSGASHARDISNHLDQDTASQSITFDANSTAIVELLNTATSIFSPDSRDYVISFVAWLSSPITLSVSGATNTNPIIIQTSVAHGMNSSGTKVIIASVTGNTAANGTWIATVVDATHFSIPVIGSGSYSGGGMAQTNTEVSLRALWTGDADIANFRLDLTTTPKRFTLRALAPSGAYTTGTYGLFFEFPQPALPSAITLNISQVQIDRVTAGASWTEPRPYIVTTSATRTIAAGVTPVQILEGANPTTLLLQLPSGAKLNLNIDGSLIATSVDSSASNNPSLSLVPRTTTGSIGGADTQDGQITHSASTTTTLTQATSFPTSGMPLNCSIFGTVEVNAHTTDYASVAIWRVDVAAKIVSGTLTVISFSPGSGAPLVSSGALATAVVAWQNFGGSDLSVVYTGVAVTNINWTFNAKIRYFT